MQMRILGVFCSTALLLLVCGVVLAQQQDSAERRLYHTVEYSDLTDDAAVVGGGAHNGKDPGQVILTTVTDFAGPPKPKNSTFDYNEEVDALANRGDAYFWSVVRNTADLLVSFEGDPGGPKPGSDTAVWWESTGGARWRMWIHDSLDCCGDPNFEDLDALETYGPGDDDDADMYSIGGDILEFSIWEKDAGGWIPKDTIVAAITALGWTGSDAFVDVDALMVDKFSSQFIFSIRSTGNWHGGEIVVKKLNSAPSFLNHGGHLWDNNWRPSMHFGVPTDEVDAIEAWGPSEDDPPEPPAEGRKVPSLTHWGLLILLIVLILSGAYVIYQRRRGTVRI